MNVIIAGASGFVGRELVAQAITSKEIRHAYILTRKSLPESLSRSQKLTIIHHEDFSSYPIELLKRLQDADGCLWAIGGTVSQFPDIETARRTSVDYTLAAARAFMHLASGRPFKFIFCSGRFAEWDQNKNLYFMEDTRLIKGQVEKGLCDLADESLEKLQVWIVRPGGILPVDAGLLERAVGTVFASISVDALGRSMMKIMAEGHGSRILENDVLLAL